MTIRGLGVAAVFLVGCVAGGVSSQLVVPKASAQQGAPSRQKWQYECQKRGSNITEMANQLGEQGWEMVAVSNTPIVWCFKRPKM